MTTLTVTTLTVAAAIVATTAAIQSDGPKRTAPPTKAGKTTMATQSSRANWVRVNTSLSASCRGRAGCAGLRWRAFVIAAHPPPLSRGAPAGGAPHAPPRCRQDDARAAAADDPRRSTPPTPSKVTKLPTREQLGERHAITL